MARTEQNINRQNNAVNTETKRQSKHIKLVAHALIGLDVSVTNKSEL